jgi:hypothetical protein
MRSTLDAINREQPLIIRCDYNERLTLILFQIYFCSTFASHIAAIWVLVTAQPLIEVFDGASQTLCRRTGAILHNHFRETNPAVHL